jgi:hypothetical protein
MENKNYNQPAFPTIEQVSNVQDWQTTEGITMLDYFAAKSIAVPATQKPRNIIHWVKWAIGMPYQSAYPCCNDLARHAYRQAAAMLKERENYIK